MPSSINFHRYFTCEEFEILLFTITFYYHKTHKSISNDCFFSFIISINTCYEQRSLCPGHARFLRLDHRGVLKGGRWAQSIFILVYWTKDFFSKYDQTCRKLRIWSHLLKKSLMENFTFCDVKAKAIILFCPIFLRKKNTANEKQMDINSVCCLQAIGCVKGLTKTSKQ